jgi:DNA helicase-2/ATP-dependent DNA helicase PcrA
MATWSNFLLAIEHGLGKNRIPDSDQQEAIRPSPETSIVIYAGPGTGKTATLTLRIIKLVLVDGLLPQQILATTFTRKAARELRSRVIDWSEKITEKLPGKLPTPDWNLIHIDTLDALSEQLLSDYRSAGERKSVLVPTRASRQVWVNILLEGYPNTHSEPHLARLSKDLKPGTGPGLPASLDAISLLRERLAQENVEPVHFFKKRRIYNLKSRGFITMNSKHS